MALNETHRRAIVGYALAVAVARQQQRRAQSTLTQAFLCGDFTGPEAIKAAGIMAAASVQLAAAVDALTDACIEAQVAHDVRSN